MENRYTDSQYRSYESGTYARFQVIVSITPPSTLGAAPVVADAYSEAA
jgi:hypothetical protein